MQRHTTLPNCRARGCGDFYSSSYSDVLLCPGGAAILAALLIMQAKCLHHHYCSPHLQATLGSMHGYDELCQRQSLVSSLSLCRRATGEIPGRPSPLKVEATNAPVAIEHFTDEIQPRHFA
jgi:hypothetical protein